MRRFLTGAALLMAILVTPSVASAQATSGDKELLFNGLLSTFMQKSFGTTSTFTFGQGILNLGLFMSDTFEVGGGPSINVSGGAGSGTSAQIGANGFLRKYFKGKVPTRQFFVGAEAYDQDFQNFSDQLFLNGLVGLKNYLSEKAALEFSESFGFNPSHPGDFQILQFKVGITVLFGK